MPSTTETRPTTSHLRLLILTPNSTPKSSNPSPVPCLLYGLTGIQPSLDVTTFAGYTSHPPLRIATKYFTTDVSIWCDEVPFPDSKSAVGHCEDEPEPTVAVPESPSTDAAPPLATTDQRLADGNAADEPPPSLSQWREQMLSLAAREVRGVIGAIVLVLPVDPVATERSASQAPLTGDMLQIVEAVNELRDAIEEDEYGREVGTVILIQATRKGKGNSKDDLEGAAVERRLDALCEALEEKLLTDRGVLGWDIVGWDGEVGIRKEGELDFRNEYGEKVGVQRVREVLEAVDWSAPVGDVGDDEFDEGLLASDGEDEEQFHDDGIRYQSHELEREMMGLKLAMRDREEGLEDDDPDAQDIGVEQLQGLMERVVAIREAGTDMAKDEREKFARREVERIMREMG